MSENTAQTPNGVSGRKELKVTEVLNINAYEIHGMDFGVEGRIMDGAAIKGGSDLQLLVGNPQIVRNNDQPKDFSIKTGNFNPSERDEVDEVLEEEIEDEGPIKE